jgi:hypothetical protein
LTTLHVVALSDSFSTLWSELARGAGAALNVVGEAGALGPAGDGLAILLATGGVEDGA